MRARGGIVTADDLREYEADLERAARARLRGHARPHARRARRSCRTCCRGSPRLRRPERDGARARASYPCSTCAAPETHTTNVSVVDDDGNACAFTTSLGLGSGDFLPGLDLHLNSMLGEVDLVVGDLVPGERMGSMMAPSLVLDGQGLVLATGAAGGTRLPTALDARARGDPRRGPRAAGGGRPAALPPDRRRPSTPRPASTRRRWRQLERAGRTVRRWPGLHHYFGGVSAVGRTRRGRATRAEAARSIMV